MKQIVGAEIAKRVKDGEVLGVGSGSTVEAALDQIGARIKKEGLSIHVVPTSYPSAWKCQQMGLHVLYPGYQGEVSWYFDGADEVDPHLWLIKGRHGALLREKILVRRAGRFVVIVDESKLVKQLTEKFAVPVEFIPEARFPVERDLKRMGARSIVLREVPTTTAPVITESGNFIVDVYFNEITAETEKAVKLIVGVVETGLFMGYTSEVIVAGQKGVYSLFPEQE
jgi:ribose 5-phosphate isomerase A